MGWWGLKICEDVSWIKVTLKCLLMIFKPRLQDTHTHRHTHLHNFWFSLANSQEICFILFYWSQVLKPIGIGIYVASRNGKESRRRWSRLKAAWKDVKTVLFEVWKRTQTRDVVSIIVWSMIIRLEGPCRGWPIRGSQGRNHVSHKSLTRQHLPEIPL